MEQGVSWVVYIQQLCCESEQEQSTKNTALQSNHWVKQSKLKLKNFKLK